MRKPALWIILALLGLLGTITAIRLFPAAFPLLSVHIEMDRETALEEARALSDRFQWDPAEARQAASFGQVDPTFQTYMELEGGGLEELNRRVEEGLFSIYLWRVRHFGHGVVEEAEILFTPDGAPYGFDLLLSEDTPGNNLPPDEARELAMAGAAGSWGVDPSLYELLESSQEEHPGGRIDHTFVFRRTDVSLGEAELRLRLRVAGDLLAQVTPFAHVPEAFEREYQDTRDANDAIGLAATIVFVLLFLVLAGGGGTVHLLRERWIEWKTPLVVGGVVAGLMALNILNGLPLAWMGYDTATAPGVFLATNAMTAVFGFVALTLLLAGTFLAGESLLRKGFPDHLQQWKLWSPGVANSTPALGLTTAPYLIVGVKLGYVVLFYIVMTRLFGWWSPASSLVAPDLLATHLPWLQAVSMSLFAALWEESLFRAIPIGVAAILGRRYGKPWLWIWSAVVLQAVVFGAGHANYPQQPAYARVVELAPPFLAWGVICVYFGLIPSIIGHFLYDLVLFSTPLFAADTSGIWLDRLVVIVVGLLPLGVVLLARWRQGGVREAPEWARNRAWAPSPSGEAWEVGASQVGTAAPLGDEGGEAVAQGTLDLEEPAPLGPSSEWSTGPAVPSWAWAGVGALSLAGLVLWTSTLTIDDSPRAEMTLGQAEAAARSVLEGEGVVLDEGWTPLFSLSSGRGDAHQFVWRQGSADAYGDLVGPFLTPPHWQVRFVRFQADPEERAEEYAVRFELSGDLLERRHLLPEARPGASLEEEEARALALGALETRLAVSPAAVREVSAEETARPNRTDWTFTFAAEEGYPLEEGEGRLTVEIAGEEIVGSRGFVHTPEEWAREWRADAQRRLLAMVSLGAVVFLLLAAAAIYGIVRGARGGLEMAPVRILAGVLLVAGVVTGLNEWPATMGALTTQIGFSNQVGMMVFVLFLGLGFLVAGVSLVGALAHTWLRDRGPSVPGPLWWGVGLGVAFTGATHLASTLTRSGPPGLPSFSNAVSYLPWMSAGLGPLVDFLSSTALALLLLATVKVLKSKGRLWQAIPLLLVVGLVISPNNTGGSWAVWGGIGVAAAVGVGLVAVLCMKLGWAILPGLVAAPTLLEQVEAALLRPFPGAYPGAVLGMVLVAGAAAYWTRALQEPGAEAGGGASG